MAVTATSLGSNSVAIAYDTQVKEEYTVEIHNFLSTHGWVSEDASWLDKSTYLSRAYKALNTDGVTYKWVRIQAHDTYFYVESMQDYDAGTEILTNKCDMRGSSTGYQNIPLDSTGGTIYIFATERWAAFTQLGVSGSRGSSSGSGMLGVFEVTSVNPSDDPATFGTHVLLNTYYLSNYNSVYHVVAPPATKAYTADPSNASKGTRIVTPFGHWGNDANYYSQCMPTGADHMEGDYLALNINLLYDTSSVTTRYLKGTIYGLKLTPANVGLTGDTLKIDCDVDLFADPAGTNADHFVMDSNTTNTAIPL